MTIVFIIIGILLVINLLLFTYSCNDCDEEVSTNEKAYYKPRLVKEEEDSQAA
ncbi:hypothetical protein GCM10009117_08190 [Gangjinia marincola]|uniref:Uncharacterized protein n=1 Tax=Gangjinia marincola TaxID=578463 RepID=A0ABN1MFL7_9FLAO